VGVKVRDVEGDLEIDGLGVPLREARVEKLSEVLIVFVGEWEGEGVDFALRLPPAWDSVTETVEERVAMAVRDTLMEAVNDPDALAVRDAILGLELGVDVRQREDDGVGVKNEVAEDVLEDKGDIDGVRLETDRVNDGLDVRHRELLDVPEENRDVEGAEERFGETLVLWVAGDREVEGQGVGRDEEVMDAEENREEEPEFVCSDVVGLGVTEEMSEGPALGETKVVAVSVTEKETLHTGDHDEKEDCDDEGVCDGKTLLVVI